MTVSSLKKIEFGRVYTRKYFVNKFFRIIFENKKIINGLIERKVLSVSDSGTIYYSVYTFTDQDNSFKRTSNMLSAKQLEILLEVEPLALCKSDIEAKILLLIDNTIYDNR